MAQRELNASAILDYYHDLGIECENTTNIDWVCQRIQSLNVVTRELTDNALKEINQQINSIPTGRQHRLKCARDQTLFYLKERCEWVLPQLKETQFKDESMKWMLEILKHSHQAGQLSKGYKTQREACMTQRWSDLGWLIVVLNMEVAPLPLHYWHAILSTPSSIEFYEGQYTLKVVHPKPIASFATKETPSFTRYALPLFPWRLLRNFYDTPHSEKREHLTTFALSDALNKWCSKAPYYLGTHAPHQWLKAFQCIWHYQYCLPAPLLRDLSDPMRHVATLCATQSQIITAANAKALFQPPVFNADSTTSIKPASRSVWPHHALIKYQQHRQVKKPPIPDWNEKDVLPKLFYHFVDELFNEGGVKQKELQAESIARYTNFYKQLTPLPLSAACDPDKLHAWAHLQFERLSDKSTPWHLYNFLRHIAHQELTDHLDLSQFERPNLPSQVDPFCLDTEHIHEVCSLLLNTKQGHPMQRLFSCIAILLGYYAMLRRGEVLRLRVRDIIVCPNDPKRFYIWVRKTAEGNPKRGKTRKVTAYLPEASAKLIRMLLKIKTLSAGRSPLLGIEGESIHLRNQQYLYPATMALKLLFGNLVRFHHLRHSGAELLYLQGLHLAYQRNEHHLSSILTPAMQTLLTPAICTARFRFWLEGQSFDNANDAILLDVIGDQLGHTYYATTRKHYIHGMEKVVRLIRPCRTITSRAELRYLLGMPNNSNDVSRVLNSLRAEYTLLSDDTLKKQHTFAIKEEELIERVSPSLARKKKENQRTTQHHTITSGVSEGQTDIWSDNALLALWVRSLPQGYHEKSPNQFHLFNRHSLRVSDGREINFPILSLQWLAINQLETLRFTTKQVTALKKLNMPELGEHIANTPPHINDETEQPTMLQLTFTCECNQKTLGAYKLLFHDGPFKRCPAILTLIQNEKSVKKSHKYQSVTSDYQRIIDTTNLRTVRQGSTQLLIELRTPILTNELIDPLSRYFTDLFNPQQKENAYG